MRYRCLQLAGVTAYLDVGEAPALVRILEPGETVLVSHVGIAANGKQRAQLSEGGWASLISESGKTLLEPESSSRWWRTPGAGGLQVVEEEIDENYEPTEAEIVEYANRLGLVRASPAPPGRS